MELPALSAVEWVTFLLLHRGVQFLHRVTHVLARFLERIELLLLIRRQHRTDLRHRFVDDRMRLFHRFLVDGDDLWPGLIDERLDFGLLVGREIERFGQMRECESLAVPASMKVSPPTGSILGLSENVTGERDGDDGRNCKQVSFHISFHWN